MASTVQQCLMARRDEYRERLARVVESARKRPGRPELVRLAEIYTEILAVIERQKEAA